MQIFKIILLSKMLFSGFHLGRGLGRLDVRNLILVNDKTNKEVIFD